MQVAFYCLGCKVNQFETWAMEEQFEALGCRIVSWKEDADIYVVNTCAVTSKAAYQSRQILNRLKRQHPDAKIIATGCHVQTDPYKIIESVGGGVCLAGNELKARIAPMSLKHTGCTGIFISDISRMKEILPLTVSRPPRGRTRAFLKIQDGCDAFCSYCIVPYARGRSRSLPKELVFRQVQDLEAHGVKEVVLTGIHIGLYGRDLEKYIDLLSLVKGLCATFGNMRFRLSSIELNELSKDFIDWAAKTPNFCRHFHIPLQSGSDRVLKDMNRRYKARDFVELVEKIKKSIPLCCIGTDVMTGFPTEGDTEFMETLDVLEKLPISYVHAFPYSLRPGTVASAMKSVTTKKEAKKRAKKIMELGRFKKEEFCKSLIGNRLQVLLERQDRDTGYVVGKSDNYVEVAVDIGPESLGNVITVEVMALNNERLIGILID